MSDIEKLMRDMEAEINRLRALLAEAREALRWYVDEDEAGGEPVGSYYRRGFDRARTVLSKLKGEA